MALVLATHCPVTGAVDLASNAAPAGEEKRRPFDQGLRRIERDRVPAVVAPGARLERPDRLVARHVHLEADTASHGSALRIFGVWTRVSREVLLRCPVWHLVTLSHVTSEGLDPSKVAGVS